MFTDIGQHVDAVSTDVILLGLLNQSVSQKQKIHNSSFPSHPLAGTRVSRNAISHYCQIK